MSVLCGFGNGLFESDIRTDSSF